MKILIIVASYNGEKYIKEQVDSLLAQEGVDVQIVVFDDVSTDKTPNIVSSYRFDNRVQLIVNEVTTGSAAKNFFGAIKFFNDDFFGKFDYVAFADQDDIWMSNKLKAATEILVQDQASLYMSNLIMWDERTGSKSMIHKSYPQKKYDFLFEGGSAGCTYVFTSDFCISLNNALEVTDYENWKFFSHDWFVYFFARVNNYQVSIDDNAFILYRIHDNNVHGQLNSNSYFALTERLKMVQQGWYIENIKGFVELLPKESKEREIYELYSKNVLSRFFVLFKYNFSLMRSSKKFIQFFVVSLLPIKLKK